MNDWAMFHREAMHCTAGGLQQPRASSTWKRGLTKNRHSNPGAARADSDRNGGGHQRPPKKIVRFRSNIDCVDSSEQIRSFGGTVDRWCCD